MVAVKKRLKTGYFVCEEQSKAIAERDTWSKGMQNWNRVSGYLGHQVTGSTILA